MLSNTPSVASAAGELALYVVRMPRPTATPIGVVSAKNAASPRYWGLRGRCQGMSALYCDVLCTSKSLTWHGMKHAQTVSKGGSGSIRAPPHKHVSTCNGLLGSLSAGVATT